MEMWNSFIISLICIAIAGLLKSLHGYFFPKLNLPPGPMPLPFIGNPIWLWRVFTDLDSTLRNLYAKYGPVVTLRVGSHPLIFVSGNSLAYQALVQNGTIFAGRPTVFPVARLVGSNQRSINSCPYGLNWRLFRRNLMAEILHPSRVRNYTHARRWVLDILVSRLTAHSEGLKSIQVMNHFQCAICGLLAFMCLGKKLEQKQIQKIGMIQGRLLSGFVRFNVLNLWPNMRKTLFRKWWEEYDNLRKDEKAILLEWIRARQRLKQEEENSEYVLSYVDTLLDLQLLEEKRKLNEKEIMTMCSEFLTAGTDTTSTALQWIMANLVKYPHIQARVFEELSGVVGEGEEVVKEEDLQKLPYLKAVVLEGLRRHSPAGLVLPHSVTQDAVLEGYHIPKNATVNFTIKEINRNPKIWENPMEFKPERFLENSMNNGDGGEEFDVTGSRVIKMMPFGAGRRICPGEGWAMLHLEYFVANLVWSFEWKAAEGDEVDLSESLDFIMVMKNPLQVRLSPRRRY